MLSSDADATSLPSSENTTVATKFECPSKVCSVIPVGESQSLTELSLDVDATSFPSGENTKPAPNLNALPESVALPR